MFERFNGKVNYWITLSDQNVFITQGYLKAAHPPNIKNIKRMWQANHHANLANAKVIKRFREMKIKGKIGPSFTYEPTYSFDSKPNNQLAADIYEELSTYVWLDIYAYGRYPKLAWTHFENDGVAPKIKDGDMDLLKKGKPDFLGLNYNKTVTVKDNPNDGVGIGRKNYTGKKGTAEESGVPGLYKAVENPFIEYTNWDWGIDPTGLRLALRRMTSRYNLPVFIAGNGLGEYDRLEAGSKVQDEYRINFIREHLIAIQEAITDGTEVLGYCVWSFTDSFSWLSGYQKRYGLVYVDRDETNLKDLKRYKKNSYDWYQKVIATNGENLFNQE